MAIEKNNVKVVASRIDTEFSVGSKSRESMSSEDYELQRRNYVDSEDDDEEFDDADSGAGSDDFDLLELGETGSEFCQVGDQTCCIPFELYDLPDLHGILSLDVWNECLTEEERFGLTKYLPDMDQQMFMRTLKELFEGGNFHFGNPVDSLYQMLKGGLCEPRVALYRQGLNFFQIHQHYHLLHKHQDSMVDSFLQMKEAWKTCKGYSIEEKLRVLNILKSQKSLMGERNEDMGYDSSERDGMTETMWDMRSNGRSSVQNGGRGPMFDISPNYNHFSRVAREAVDTNRGRKPNSRLLKMAGSNLSLQNDAAQRFHHGHQSVKTGPYGLDISRGAKGSAYDVVSVSADDEQERMYEMPSQRDWNVAHGNMIDQGQVMKPGKKRVVPKGGECDAGSYSSPHLSAKSDFSGHGRNLDINQLSDIKVLTAKPSNLRGFYDPAKRAIYGEDTYMDHIGPVKGRAAQMGMKGNLGNYVDVSPQYWSKKTQGQACFAEPSFNYEDRGGESRKMKRGRELPNPRLKTLQASGSHSDDRGYVLDRRAKVSQHNIRGVSERNGRSSMLPFNSGRMFHGGEDTESDSSDQLGDEEENHLIMSNGVLHSRLEASRSALSASIIGKMEKRAKKSANGNTLVFEGIPASNNLSDIGRHGQRQEMDSYYLKSRQSPKTQHMDALHNFTPGFPENIYYGGLGNTNAEINRLPAYILERNGQVQAQFGGNLSVPMDSSVPFDRRLKDNVGHDTFSRKSKHMQEYSMEEDGAIFEGKPIRGSSRSIDVTLIGCSSTSKKNKRKVIPAEMDEHERSEYMQYHEPMSESISLKSWGKKRQEDNGSPGAGSSEQPVVDPGVEELEPEIKPQKKPSPPITPTIHTGFSFSVIHLLSAVRVALVTPNTGDSSEPQKHLEIPGAGLEDQNAKHEQTNGSVEQIDVNNPAHSERANGSIEQIDVNNPAQPEETSLPSLTVHDIVNRVRLNPGDPSILETQEPLQDLVRGVLKIFASKTAPLSAKGWKPLISYDRSSKCWSWTGPGPQTPTDDEPLEEVISPEAWTIPRKMLVKLVDSFANWLKCGQETLQQIGSLPAPPAELMKLNLDEKERFRDLRAQRSLTTISLSSEEVRSYFRKEEHLRYSVPDRAFSYTAADGKKSIVAPLRRCGGKPTSKARDHFMLKRDRPPHVTILCLVRDAAARLPGSIGTRADVCTLIRDSQYIVEDVSDSQVNQVVSGALDRLHYERDPCVQFDGERKLWVYLHREREEEDFEDDGTSSTKKWKRQKKDAAEQDDQVTVVCPGSVEHTGLDPSSDLNAEPPCMNDDKVDEVMYDDARETLDDDTNINPMPEQVAMLESEPSGLENSKGEDRDDGT